MLFNSLLRRAGRSRFLNRSLALFLALVLLLALLPRLEIRAEAAYYDEAIQKLMGWNVMQGYPDGSLHADSNITRAEFVALINRAYGYDETTQIPFTDVPVSSWYHNDISAAYAAGYFSGTSTVTAEPSRVLTREQAMVMLARNMRLEEGAGEVTSFSDGRAFQSYSAGYVNTAVEKGLVSGYGDGSFRPGGNITRGEMAVMLSRALGNLVNGEGTYVLGDVFGNVTINTTNVTLRDTVIAGDLYLTGGLGLGGVTLENVTVLGDIIVAGGGESDSGESVILRNVTADNIIVDTLLGEYVSLRAEGDTNIAKARLISDTYLQDRTPSGLGFKTIRLEGMGGAYSLSGNLENVINAAPGSMLRVAQAIAANLTMDETAVGASLWLDSSATVLNLSLDTPTAVAGWGDIRKLNVNVAGTSVEKLPDAIEIRPGLTGTIAGETMDSTAAAEASSEPHLQANYPKVINVAATGATATFSTNKSGTVYWAITVVSDGSVDEEGLLTPAAKSTIVKSGNLRAERSNTVYSTNITGLTSGGNYYLSAMLVDARGDYSPIKVVSFTTTDNSTPAFGSGYPHMVEIEKTYADAAVMATKDCQLYWVVFEKGSSAPTAASFRAGAFTNSYGYGITDMERNISKTFRINTLKELEELSSYDVYFWLNDPDSAKSSAVKKLSFTTPDRTPPIITTTPYVTNIAATSLRLSTTVNEAGTFYWVVVESGEEYPKQPTTNIKNKPQGPEKEADYDAYFKLQIANGMNGLKAGSVKVQPNTNATINITGLKAETEYKIYYIAKDNAGNFSEFEEALGKLPNVGSEPGGYELKSNFIYQSTLDNSGPTVRQDFDLKLDDTHPLADTNIRIIFSERVQYHDALNNHYKPLDEASDEYWDIMSPDSNSSPEEKKKAADEFAALLRKVILLYGSDGELVKERTWDPDDPDAEDYGGDDWVIDYRNARVLPPEGRELVILFPTDPDPITGKPTKDSALNLNSDATYRFNITNVTDTYTSPNKIDPNPYPLDTFTTVAAQALLRNADLSPKEIEIATDKKNEDGSNATEKVEVDTLFSLTPSSVSRADPTKVWDMLIWAQLDVQLELYMKVVDRSEDKGSPGATGWKKVEAVTGREDNVVNVIEHRNMPNQNRGSFVGLSLWQDLKGSSYNPHIRADAITETQEKQGYFGLEDDKIYYFAIRLETIETLKRDDYTGSVDLWITVDTADEQDLSDLVSVGTLYEARYTGEFRDKTVSEISSSLTVDENGRFIRKATFAEKAAPEFANGFPKIDKDDTWAKVSLQLERPGTVFYVLAPAEGNNGVLNTTRLYDSTAHATGKEQFLGADGEDAAGVKSETVGTGVHKWKEYGHETAVNFNDYDIPKGDGAYYESSYVIFNDGKGDLNDESTWYPLYLKSPTNRDIFNPGSYITNNDYNQYGSVEANNVGIATIDLNGLEPERKYFLYLVIVGESGISSNYAQLFQFETNEANRPDVDVSRPQTQLVTVTSTDMDATVNYALFNLNSLGSTILGKKFVDSQVMTAEAKAKFEGEYAGREDLDGNTITEYTVLQAILNRPGTNGSLDSFFDVYASTEGKRAVRQFVTSSIPSSTVIAVGNVDLAEDETLTIDCAKEYNIDTQNYYFLTVSRYQHISSSDLNNLSEDSYSFRAQSPIYVADNEPPLLREISGNITLKYNNGTPTVTGEITMTFDQPLWYVEDTYTKYPIHQHEDDLYVKDADGKDTKDVAFWSTKHLSKYHSTGIEIKNYSEDFYKGRATSVITLSVNMTSLTGFVDLEDGVIAKEFSETLGTVHLYLDFGSVTNGLADRASNYVEYTPNKGSSYQTIWVAGSENNVNIHVDSDAPRVQVVSLNPASLEMKSRTAELIASVTFTSASDESLVTWTSSDSSVVTVSQPSTLDTYSTATRTHGNHKVILEAKSAGNATITATCNGVSATCSVTVDSSAVPTSSPGTEIGPTISTGPNRAPANVTASFGEGEYEVQVGKTLYLKNQLSLSNGADLTNAKIIWESSNRNVASVSSYIEGAGGNEGGIVAGHQANRTATITATITTEDGKTYVAKTTVKVTA